MPDGLLRDPVKLPEPLDRKHLPSGPIVPLSPFLGTKDLREDCPPALLLSQEQVIVKDCTAASVANPESSSSHGLTRQYANIEDLVVSSRLVCVWILRKNAL